MALINCPACNKKVSNKAQQCQHCDFILQGLDQDAMERQANLQKLNQSQSIMTQSIIAMLLFVGGFAYTFWNGDIKSDWSLTVGYTCSGIGLIWYLYNRVRLVLHKRKGG